MGKKAQMNLKTDNWSILVQLVMTEGSTVRCKSKKEINKKRETGFQGPFQTLPRSLEKLKGQI